MYYVQRIHDKFVHIDQLLLGMSELLLLRWGLDSFLVLYLPLLLVLSSPALHPLHHQFVRELLATLENLHQYQHLSLSHLDLFQIPYPLHFLNHFQIPYLNRLDLLHLIAHHLLNHFLLIYHHSNFLHCPHFHYCQFLQIAH